LCGCRPCGGRAPVAPVRLGRHVRRDSGADRRGCCGDRRRSGAPEAPGEFSQEVLLAAHLLHVLKRNEPFCQPVEFYAKMPSSSGLLFFEGFSRILTR